MIKISQIDTLQFSSVFHDIKTLVRRGLVDPELGTISKQSQLLLEHCMKLTPPGQSAKSRGVGTENRITEVGQGRRRVEVDVNKVFHPIDPDKLHSKELAKLVRRSDMNAWNAMARHISTGPLAGTVAIVPTESVHNANRDRRGRAKRTRYVTLWKQSRELKDVMKAAQARVGWAKAGWIKAYKALRGTRIPQFAGKFAGLRGIFQDGRGSSENPYIGAYNDTGWGNAGESKRIVSNAMRAREKAMRTYFNTMMRLASEGKPTQWQTKAASVAANTVI